MTEAERSAEPETSTPPRADGAIDNTIPLSAPLIDAIGQYLSRRPWFEVNQILMRLHDELGASGRLPNRGSHDHARLVQAAED